ncbi:MAG: hypothetical protein A3F35_01275 [Candidatus Woykebacteria bacterium RIFCSPHIGHO2_12_FULL_45_10]|uniref:Uncharacterized protein n=1 Tax=Candidatus Woykebacteria bacterium RIFCSPHIGHO2_12_FULL_45_10 TaxID=1802603 RepID=A0A1G1WRA2_9BACT|nr:MAG: hypothetical protein A3F35_01275 [Candidatus Woykebacteria bacterium RIFCSPHIGHO2_12_FULL_45_10]
MLFSIFSWEGGVVVLKTLETWQFSITLGIVTAALFGCSIVMFVVFVLHPSVITALFAFLFIGLTLYFGLRSADAYQERKWQNRKSKRWR